MVYVLCYTTKAKTNAAEIYTDTPHTEYSALITHRIAVGIAEEKRRRKKTYEIDKREVNNPST